MCQHEIISRSRCSSDSITILAVLLSRLEKSIPRPTSRSRALPASHAEHYRESACTCQVLSLMSLFSLNVPDRDRFPFHALCPLLPAVEILLVLMSLQPFPPRDVPRTSAHGMSLARRSPEPSCDARIVLCRRGNHLAVSLPSCRLSAARANYPWCDELVI